MYIIICGVIVEYRIIKVIRDDNVNQKYKYRLIPKVFRLIHFKMEMERYFKITEVFIYSIWNNVKCILYYRIGLFVDDKHHYLKWNHTFENNLKGEKK